MVSRLKAYLISWVKLKLFLVNHFKVQVNHLDILKLEIFPLKALATSLGPYLSQQIEILKCVLFLGTYPGMYPNLGDGFIYS